MRRPIYRLMKRIATRALIELTPETGRRNQIRVHLADAECTIIGDRKYGGMSIPKPPRSRCGRMNDCPGNVAKDAKYTVRSGPTGPYRARLCDSASQDLKAGERPPFLRDAQSRG